MGGKPKIKAPEQERGIAGKGAVALVPVSVLTTDTFEWLRIGRLIAFSARPESAGWSIPGEFFNFFETFPVYFRLFI
jgi:hypothetical protein